MALVSHHEENNLQSTIELARSVATMIQTFAPTFSSALCLPSVNPDVSATIIEGLPKIFSDQQDNIYIAKQMALAAAFVVGEPFQYLQQNDGQLVADIRPNMALKDTQSSGGAMEFGWHSDDAFFEPEVRTHWIMLSGYWNPDKTGTKIAPLNEIIARLSSTTLGILLQKRFSIRIPVTIGSDQERWTKAISILKTNNKQEYEIAVPTFDVRPDHEMDREATNAIKALVDAANSVNTLYSLEDGSLIIFDNNKCLHARDQIASDRHIFRTYIRKDLEELKKQAEGGEYVFDAQRLRCYA